MSIILKPVQPDSHQDFIGKVMSSVLSDIFMLLQEPPSGGQQEDLMQVWHVSEPDADTAFDICPVAETKSR